MTAHIDPATLARVLGGDHSGNNVTAPGPNNIDRRNDRSMSITIDPNAPDGFVVHSHSAKNTDIECKDYVRRALGLPGWRPAMREPEPPKPRPTVVCHYVYEDRDGEPYLRVTRKSDKSFSQSHWHIDGWQSGKPRGAVIPYRLPDILANADQIIHLVEGEKSADYLRSLGLIATTAPGGGSAFPLTPDFAVWFDGQRVRAYPDDDTTGRKWAERVSQCIPHADIIWLDGDRGGKTGADDWLQVGGRTVDDLINAVSRPDIIVADQDEYPVDTTPDDAPPVPSIRATPFEWCDPLTIKPRAWLYGNHLIRRFVSLTVSPGGIGKSSLVLMESLCMASGRSLLIDDQCRTPDPLRVWYWNGEDPQDETQRRVIAASLHHGLTPADIGGRLFTDSGREQTILLGQIMRGEITLCEELFETLEAEILARSIDVFIIDPFVSSHRLGENDNNAIDAVIKRLGKLSERANCAVEIIHHVRKPSGSSRDATDVNDARGASALIGGVRSARVLNVMSEEIAESCGIPADQRYSYFSVANGKANMTPRSGDARWRRLVDYDLKNGPPGESDRVGVVTHYKLKVEDVATERTNNLSNTESVILDIVRQNDMTRHWGGRNVPPRGWLGRAVIDRMGLIDVPNGRINHIIKNMLDDGRLILRSTRDDGNEVSCYALPGASERADDIELPDYGDDPF